MATSDLTGRDLDAAVSLTVYADDLGVHDDEYRLSDACDQFMSDKFGTERWSKVNSFGDFDTSGLLAWRQRKGSPYDSAIESHVAAYRADPPRHDPLQVIDDLRQRGLFIAIMPMPIGYDVVTSSVAGNLMDAEWDRQVQPSDLRETILRAAVRLCGNLADSEQADIDATRSSHDNADG